MCAVNNSALELGTVATNESVSVHALLAAAMTAGGDRIGRSFGCTTSRNIKFVNVTSDETPANCSTNRARTALMSSVCAFFVPTLHVAPPQLSPPTPPPTAPPMPMSLSMSSMSDDASRNIAIGVGVGACVLLVVAAVVGVVIVRRREPRAVDGVTTISANDNGSATGGEEMMSARDVVVVTPAPTSHYASISKVLATENYSQPLTKKTSQCKCKRNVKIFNLRVS